LAGRGFAGVSIPFTSIPQGVGALQTKK